MGLSLLNAQLRSARPHSHSRCRAATRFAPCTRAFRLVVLACDEATNPGDDSDESPQTEPPSVSNAMHYSLSEVARIQGRVSGRTNLFLVNESEEGWRRLDKKVNKYPIQRAFTAIGSGGAEFKASMIKAVETVVGPVHIECISERSSSRGSYISVTVGPVWVESCEQVIQIYSNMKECGSGNIKWII